MDIRLVCKNGEIRRIPLQNCHYDTLSYPLLHPNGEAGWNFEKDLITALKYYRSRLQLREEPWIDNMPPSERQNIKNQFLQMGKVSQVYYLDMAHKITAMNLEFIKLPSTQDKFKTNSYQALVDELGGIESEKKSANIFLPETVKGTPRYMYSQYQQTLAIASEYGLSLIHI